MAKNAAVWVRPLRALAGQVPAGQTDQHLLERFVRQRDETAFAALLERHGPMVLGVCRRTLRDAHLAEDVFQATFLVLIRNARAIRKRQSLSGWLHGVALRLARKARADAARAERHDQRSALGSPPDPPTETSWREVQQILDDELQRLPTRYRLPLILCYLEGRTRDDAAAQLGWSPGRLKGLLERGRERLRCALVRRGLAPAALAPLVLAESALAAPVPPLLAVSTLRTGLRVAAGEGILACDVSETVAHLVEGGMGSMGPKKLILVLVLALGLSVLGTGAGVLAQLSAPTGTGSDPETLAGAIEPAAEVRNSPSQAPPDVRAASDKEPEMTKPTPPAQEAPKDDKQALQGAWHAESLQVDGEDATELLQKRVLPAFVFTDWTVKGDIIEFREGGHYCSASFTIDPGKKPREIDIAPLSPREQRESDPPNRGVYTLDGDTWTICFGNDPGHLDLGHSPPKGRQRPKEVASTKDNKAVVITLKRVPPEKAKPQEKTQPEVSWRERATLKAVAMPDDWWKPGGLFPALLQFAPDGQRLVVGKQSQRSHIATFALLDLRTDKDLTDPTIRGQDGRIESHFLGFTKDGKAWGWREVASGPNLAGFALVDWASGKERSRVSEKGRWRAALSPDGKVLAAIDSEGKVMLWDADTGKALGILDSPPTDYFGFLAFSPDSKTLATAGFPPNRFGIHIPSPPEANRANLVFWDVATRKEKVSRTLNGEKADLGMPSMPNGFESARSMRFGPDGRRLAVACRVVLPGQPYAQTALRLWDVDGLKEGPQLQSEEHGSLRDFAFSPDGKTVAVAWYGAARSRGPGQATVYTPAPLVLLDSTTGKELSRIPPPRSGFAAVAFSPDGQLLATQDNEGTVKVWQHPASNGEKNSSKPDDKTPAKADPVLKYEIAADATQPFGAPVLLKIIMTNTGQEPLRYWQGLGDYLPVGDRKAWVTDAGGKTREVALSNGQGVGGSGSRKSLAVGASVVIPAALDPLPKGSYLIEYDGGSARVTIKDDAELLKTREQDLLTRVGKNDSFAQYVVTAYLTRALFEECVRKLSAPEDETALPFALTLYRVRQLPEGSVPVLAEAIDKQLTPQWTRQRRGGTLALLTALAGQIGSDEALELVVKTAHSELSEGSGIGALGMFKQERATKELHDFLKNKDESIRYAAAHTLAQRRDAAAIEVLVAVAGDSESSTFRGGACMALVNFPNDPRAESAIRGRLDDLYCKDQAKEALKQLRAAREKKE
jgi:RNA polymerase sigma-70 factor (ECF subfamily)